MLKVSEWAVECVDVCVCVFVCERDWEKDEAQGSTNNKGRTVFFCYSLLMVFLITLHQLVKYQRDSLMETIISDNFKDIVIWENYVTLVKFVYFIINFYDTL